MAKKFLTLNIGAANVELAEYEAGSRGALTLVNYGVAPLAAPLDGGDVGTILSSALLEAMQASGIAPGKVSISIAGQMVFLRSAAIPAAGGAERFEQMVRYEVEQNIPFPIDEMVCDRQVLGETENGDKSVLIVAAKVDQVEAITDAVASVGFVPELVGVAPLGLVNALYVARPDEGCAIILDLGAKTTSLAIAEGDRIYNRSIPVAGNAITKEIATALGCSLDEAEQVKLEKGYVSMGGVTEDDDAVADCVSKACRAVLTRLNAEISRSINFYRSQQGGGAPTKLYLTGGTSLLPQIDQFFAESLGIEVEYLNPFELIGVGPKVDATAVEADGARIAATTGLALQGAGDVRFAVNLLPPALVAARAEKAKIPFVVAGGLFLVAALALVMVSVNRQVAVVEERRDAVAAQLTQLRNDDRLVGAAQKALSEQEAKVAKLTDLFARRTVVLRRLGVIGKALEGRTGAWIEKGGDTGVTVRQWNDGVQAKTGKTSAESIAAVLAGGDTNVINAASVKIASMSEIGRKAEVKQFTVEFKGK